MIIYCVNGIARAGKDTFVDAVLSSPHMTGLKISTVDEVKLIAADKFGWDGVKDEKGRKLLATIRSAWGDYNEGPIDAVGETIWYACIEKKDIVFIMVREFPEMMKLVKRFEARTLNIERKGIPIGATEQAFLDMVPEGYVYDEVLYNWGSIVDWCHTACDFAEGIKEKVHESD